MNKLNEIGVTTWIRYVDDVFSQVKKDADINEVLLTLNSLDKNIEFTVELAIDNKLPFLDTCVVKNLTNYSTKLYHKPTFTGVYLNWTSLTSRKYKIGLINCLCDRIWKITSDEKQRMIEIEEIKQILIKNDYPPNIIQLGVDKFIKRKRKPDPPEPPNINGPTNKEEKETPKTSKLFFSLPYVSKKAESFAIRLKSSVEKVYPHLDFNVAFKTPGDIGKLFPFKDKIKAKEMQSLVIYKIKCETCDATYIGKTKRHFKTRMSEHNNPKNKNCSAIQMHLNEHPNHKINPLNAEIIGKAKDDRKLLIKEWILIKNQKPSLNTQFARELGKFSRNLNMILIDHLV